MEAKTRFDLFSNKVILAPMVRENSLPFRLLCLKHGADLVYTEELIDYKLSVCRRLENKPLGTIDFVDDRGEVVLRTCSEEKDRLVLQLGSNNPERALKAAKLVCQDVIAIDFNFGCPKSFSLSGGMGAALLDKPDQIKALLTTCVKNLDIPVTCKIRVLPDLAATINLVKIIESCGVSAIAVHGRTKDQRPHHENRNEFLRAIAKEISIPLIANGGSSRMKDYSSAMEFKNSTKASSVMIARAAMKNPSIFNSNNIIESAENMIKEFLKLAVRYDNYLATTKYTIQALIAGGHFGGEFIQRVHAASDYSTVCDLFNLSDWYAQNRLVVDKGDFYGDKPSDTELDRYICEKKVVLDTQGIELICDSVSYISKIYTYSKVPTPKAILMEHVNKNPAEKPKFDVFCFNQHRYFCLLFYKGACYLNKSSSNSKKGSEQAAALLACERLYLIDLKDYKGRVVEGSSRNIN